jgi:hypothetical protein
VPTSTPANSATAAAQATVAARSPTATPANSATAAAQSTAVAAQQLAHASGTGAKPGATTGQSGAGDNGGPAGASGSTGTTVPGESGSASGSGGNNGSSGDGNTGGAPTSRLALIDLSKYVDEKGVVHQDVRVTDKTNSILVYIPANTTMLTADKRPLLSMSVDAVADHPVTADGQFVIGSALDFNPSGATFSPAITIGMTYDPTKLPAGLTQGELTLGYFDTSQGKWVTLDSSVDSGSHLVSAQTTHFSTYSVMNKPPASVNWTLLLIILALEAAAAVLAYAYIRRRRLAQEAAGYDAEADGDGDNTQFGEDEGYDWWMFRWPGAGDDGPAGLITALLGAPTRRAEDVVEGEIIAEEDAGGTSTAVDDRPSGSNKTKGFGSTNGFGTNGKQPIEDEPNKPPGSGHADNGH